MNTFGMICAAVSLMIFVITAVWAVVDNESPVLTPKQRLVGILAAAVASIGLFWAINTAL